MMSNDMDLLRDYAQRNSEEAFATLVARYVNLVYSVAFRHVGDTHQAEEITQVVFIILARKAASLSPRTILSGWLCRTARYVSSRSLKMHQRRQAREQEAYMQSLTHDPDSAAWTHVAPLLDGALAQLSAKDHDAIVLRFFNGKSFKEVGAAMGASEDTAKKRVSRTLEKLRKIFLKRGVVISTAAIAGAVAANSVQAAPTTLASSVTAVALAKGAAASGSTLALMKGAVKIMAWTKMKTAVVVGIIAIVSAGGTMVTVKAVEKHHEDALWAYFNKTQQQLMNANFGKAPQGVSIRHTEPTAPYGFFGGPNNSMVEFHAPASEIFAHAYKGTKVRIENKELLPPGDFDFAVTIRHQPLEALKEAARQKFGLVAVKETRDADVLVLTVANSNPPHFRLSTNGVDPYWKWGNGGAELKNEPMRQIALFIEQRLDIPVVDQTGLDGNYDIELSWNKGKVDPNVFKKAVFEQLGLQLTPAHQPLEMLVLKKVR